MKRMAESAAAGQRYRVCSIRSLREGRAANREQERGEQQSPQQSRAYSVAESFHGRTLAARLAKANSHERQTPMKDIAVLVIADAEALSALRSCAGGPYK